MAHRFGGADELEKVVSFWRFNYRRSQAIYRIGQIRQAERKITEATAAYRESVAIGEQAVARELQTSLLAGALRVMQREGNILSRVLRDAWDRGDLRRWLAPLDDAAASACVRAERALSRALSGSCQLPLAAYAMSKAGEIRLRGLVAMPDGSKVVRAELSGPIAAPENLGEMLATQLRTLGADAILASLS